MPIKTDRGSFRRVEHRQVDWTAELERFAKYRAQLEKRLPRLQQLHGEGELAPEALDLIEELQLACEELSVANEEMRVQNEALADLANALSSERRQFERLFEMAPEALFITDPYGRLRECSARSREAFGIVADGSRGKPLVNFLVGKDRRAFRLAVLAMRGATTPGELNVVIRPRKPGTPFSAWLSATAMRGPKGELQCLYWTLRNLGEVPAATLESSRPSNDDATASAEDERGLPSGQPNEMDDDADLALEGDGEPEPPEP